MRLTLLFLCVPAVALGQGGFIRQIHTFENQPVIYDMPVSTDTGSVMSRPLTADSAIFQLYTTVTSTSNTQTLKKLDEKAVGTFMPVTTVEILSEDPYFPPRTRADKPYGVRINVSALQASNPLVPQYAKTINVTRSYGLYDPVTHQPTGETGYYADSFAFTQDGNYVDNMIIQRLPGENPSLLSGEEIYTAGLNPPGKPVSELGKATVQIWPVATAAIEGIEEGKRYLQVPGDGRFAVKNLYPQSVTYAQIYKGPHVIGTTGDPLPSTVVSYNTHAPQNAVLTLTDLESFVDLDGDYTIEILTITPFQNGAPELLEHVTFNLKRTIKVNATVTTFE